MTSQTSDIPSQILEQAHALGFDRYLPFLTNEHIASYEMRASAAERAQLEEWFGIEQIYNPKPSNHVLATSLYWKHATKGATDLPEPTMDLLQNAWKLGIATRRDPWAHYTLPILRGAQMLADSKSGTTVRVYLAKDLAFLLPELTKHCEVYLMRHSSILHNPGAMWRFLAFEDVPHIVTIVDSDLLDQPDVAIKRSEQWITKNVATWRRAKGKESDAKSFIYRPFTANRLGTRVRLPMRRLMMAYVWHMLNGTFPKEVDFPGQGMLRQFGSAWPVYGFDELFLAAAVYPRILADGNAVLCPAPAPTLFPLDMALTMGANACSYHVKS